MIKLGLLGTIFLGIVAISITPRAEAQSVSDPVHRNGSVPSDVPKECKESDIGKYGHPFIFPRREGVATGVSVEKTHFKPQEKILVNIWVSNESPREIRTFSCCESTFLLYFRVLDALGNSLPSKSDPDAIGKPGTGCGCSSGIISLPRGSCGVIAGGTLNRTDNAYTLPPGKYTIVERLGRSHPTEPAGGQSGTTGLTITVEP